MSPRRSNLIIIATLLAAMMLDAFLLPESIIAWAPLWLFLTLGFWAITLPGGIRFEIAWGFGLLQDLLIGVWTGVHVLSYSVLLYLWARLYVYILHAHPIYHVLFTLAVLAVHLAYLQLVLHLMTGIPLLPGQWRHWVGSVVVALPLFLALGPLRRRILST